MKLKDLFNRATNKNNKQVSFCLKKRKLSTSGININKLMDMELKDDEDFLR
jgi:hypothetical protein